MNIIKVWSYFKIDEVLQKNLDLLSKRKQKEVIFTTYTAFIRDFCSLNKILAYTQSDGTVISFFETF